MVVRDEVRLLLLYAVKYTPPKNQAQGKKAVRRDILRTMRPIYPEEMTKSKGLARIVRTRNVISFNAAAENFSGSLKNARAVEFEARIHTGQRDGRLRVNPGKLNGKTVVLGRAQGALLSAYIRKIEGHVGIAKSGWWPALKAVGGAAPAWVTRHGNTAGDVVDETAIAGTTPTVTVINRTGWGYRDGMRILNDAARERAKAMMTKVNALVRGLNTPIGNGRSSVSFHEASPNEGEE